jgi:4-hydroxymandelate oxidase
MYLSTSPGSVGMPAPARRVPLRLSRLAGRTFSAGRPYLPDPLEPSLGRLQADLVRPYSVRFRPELLERGERNTFIEMTQELLTGLPPLEDPLDLVLVAHTAPDADPRRSTSCHLADVLPGDPLAFNLSDQGTAAGFTALRLVSEYAAADAFRHALVVLLDQRSFLYDTAGAPDVPRQDCAVALLFGPEGRAGEPVTRQLAGVAPDEVRTALDAVLNEPDGGGAGRPVTLITGQGLDAERFGPGFDVRPAPPGRPCTGPWSALAEVLPEFAEDGPRHGPRRLVVAEYDSTLRYLCVSTLDLEEGP